MRDDLTQATEPISAPTVTAEEPEPQVDKHVTTTLNGHLPVEPLIQVNKRYKSQEPINGGDQSDSEAETAILSGKEDGRTPSRRRIIRHEGRLRDQEETNGNKDPWPGIEQGSESGGSERHSRQQNEPDAPSNKTTNGSTKIPRSILSSVSPQYRSFSRASSESARHSHSKDSINRKRKVLNDQVEGRAQKRRLRQQLPSESTINPDERRKVVIPRSESPPVRQRKRTLSLHSAEPLGLRKRRKGLNLQQSRVKDKDEFEGDSDHSGSSHVHPSLLKLASTDGIALSPAQMAVHKKGRDKNGRTPLAKACASESLDVVLAKLAERPDDIDVADNAENTPLQIASLEGQDEIVKALLDAGCDITCKNIDQDTPLIDAVENGHLGVINLLLEAGVDPRQSNSKGEEPLDLLDPDEENYEAIKDALVKAKEKEKWRRPSEDHHLQASSTRPGVPPQDSPALHGTRNAQHSFSRRRTGRSESTRNDLLWVTPSPEKLREAASTGDIAAVDYILNIQPMGDIEAVLAAAKGCHEPCLQLLLAIGNPQPDPEPLSEYKPGYNTPMLAAIGANRGSVGVIKLLLNQPDFNPTRRMHRDKTYHEIARERQGISWEEEYGILKDAHDEYKAMKKGSPNEQTNREGKRSKREEHLQATAATSKQRILEFSKDVVARKKHHAESKDSANSRLRDISTRVHVSDRQHLRVPERSLSRESSVVISDREASPVDVYKNVKRPRSLSDSVKTEPHEQQRLKPKRKLVSGKVLKDDEERKRRASHVSLASPTPSQEQTTQKTDSMTAKIEDQDSGDGFPNDAAKKRVRSSASPAVLPSPDSNILGGSSNIQAELKRHKNETEAKIIRKSPPALTLLPSTVEATQVTPTVSSSYPANTMLTQGMAPVAFMGHPNVKQNYVSGSHSNITGVRIKDEMELTESDGSSHTIQDSRESQGGSQEYFQRSEKTQAVHSSEADEPDRQREEQLLPQHRFQERAAHEQVNHNAREERTRLGEERLVMEPGHNAQTGLESDAARLEKQHTEAAEMVQKQTESESLQKEEQGLQEYRRFEQLERERQLEIQRQQNMERERREALPNALRIAAELDTDAATQPDEIKSWLPLYSATGQQIISGCDGVAGKELWILNIQAAPVLGISDLELSGFTAWTKIMTAPEHRRFVWRVLKIMLTRCKPPPFEPVDVKLENRMVQENEPKYFALKHLFWVKHTDLLETASSYPHLADMMPRLRCTGPLALRDSALNQPVNAKKGLTQIPPVRDDVLVQRLSAI